MIKFSAFRWMFPSQWKNEKRLQFQTVLNYTLKDPKNGSQTSLAETETAY